MTPERMRQIERNVELLQKRMEEHHFLEGYGWKYLPEHGVWKKTLENGEDIFSDRETLLHALHREDE